MTEELFLTATDTELRGALIDNGVLKDLFIEQSEQASVVGNIYLGRIERVIAAMEAAFVDVGLRRSGFLTLGNGRRSTGEPVSSVFEGEKVLVQVIKDSIPGKGVQLSRQISLPGRYLVYTPLRKGIMISRKITDKEERVRLENLMQESLQIEEGIILRTAALGVNGIDLIADYMLVKNDWNKIKDQKAKAKVPSCVHAELNPVARLLRDYALANIKAIHVDNFAIQEDVTTFCKEFMPTLTPKVQLHPETGDLFEDFGIEEQIDEAFERRINLPSGGNIVIETTEAMTSIDVNSGRGERATDLEQIAFKTNCEAAEVATRQIRLRNIAGLIVIDFIHMIEKANWEFLLKKVEAIAKLDRIPTRVLGVTTGGLVEITRRRKRRPLLNLMTVNCPACEGDGRVKAIEVVAIEILKNLKKAALRAPNKTLIIYAAKEVIDYFESGSTGLLGDFTDQLVVKVILRVVAEYSRNQYEIVLD